MKEKAKGMHRKGRRVSQSKKQILMVMNHSAYLCVKVNGVCAREGALGQLCGEKVLGV